MTKLILMLSTVVLSSSAFAATTVSLDLPQGGKTVLALDSGFNLAAYDCVTSAAVMAGSTFTSKFPVATVWADQVKYTHSGSVTIFTMRTSAPINGRWHHQFVSVSTTSNRSCTAGGTTILGESAD